MLIGQFLIDFIVISTLILFTVKYRNFTLLIWMIGFYGLRGGLFIVILFITQTTTKFPKPTGMYWCSQGVPSFAVPYGLTRDFYYSGHTGFIVFAYKVWSTRNVIMKYITLFGVVYIMILLIITRAHYTADVFGGWLFGSWFYLLIFWVA